ncbi:hypothetical protein NEF87_001297 [Candidatus Lokiarchaeum ossiferum]|uniref:Uncharacterized protein n=1 Tax=Candidatus Lokiarchaeum ossiferum TaxID=2951803 RepID=A0ABY6HQ45_9ARCH|nr:hypothetical protein NEF87_001297 [Candidatus Lokiarchaeum sp. B-35]
MSADENSFDKLNQDFSGYLRQLKKEKAHQSIFLLSEAYVAIVKQFNVNADEYLYYLEKFNTSPRSEFDLSKTEIVLYLKGLIEQLERIFNKKIDIDSLRLMSENSSLDATNSTVPSEEFSPTEINTIHPSSSSEIDVVSHHSESKEFIIDTSIHPSEVRSPNSHSSKDNIIEEIGKYPDLVEIYKATVEDSSPNDIDSKTKRSKSENEWEDFTMERVKKPNVSENSSGDQDILAILQRIDSVSQSELKMGDHIAPSSSYSRVKPLKAFGFPDVIPKFSPKQ